MTQKIAVVVVTFNRWNQLSKTIKRLVGEGIAQEDIYVVDNNSIDGTKLNLKNDFPLVNGIWLEENIASAGGFAKGMQETHERGYDWVLLFNDDSRPTEHSMAMAIKHLGTPGIDLLKIANLNDQGQAILLYWKGVRTPKFVPVSQVPVATDLVTFDGCFISARVMDAIGYCDPSYFMGTYEFDYCLKARKAGFGIYTLPNGLIEDEKLGSASGTPPWRQYYNTRNHLALGLKQRSFSTIKAWVFRELKYTYAILRFGDKKSERLHFKFRAVRDALLGRSGKRYLPEAESKK